MTLAIAYAREVSCWPAHLWFCCEEPTMGAVCRTCGRDVAMPVARSGDRPVCIYCGMESGLVEAIDRPFGEAA